MFGCRNRRFTGEDAARVLTMERHVLPPFEPHGRECARSEPEVIRAAPVGLVVQRTKAGAREIRGLVLLVSSLFQQFNRELKKLPIIFFAPPELAALKSRQELGVFFVS
jgi:hypothetical protein